QGVDGHAAVVDGPALRLAGDRIDVVVGAIAAVGVAPDQRQRAAAGPVAVADGQFVALVDFQRTGHAPAVAGLAEHDAAAGFVATAVGRGVVLELDGDAVDLRPGDDVHHAGDRVGAVDRGRTVLQDFDVVDRHVGQDVE